MKAKIPSDVRSRYSGLFGFEQNMAAHHNALMAAMRHYESVGDDRSLGVVLLALVRGRKPWMMDLRYKYFKIAKLERFSEVLLVLFRWIIRNVHPPLDELRRLLKKVEQHLPDRNKRKIVSEYLYRALEDAGRIADAYDVAQLMGRHDWMGLMRKNQMDQAIGRGAVDMYRPIDPVSWTRAARNAKSLQTDAERHLRQAMKENPTDTANRIHLVELLLAGGDIHGALTVCSCGSDGHGNGTDSHKNALDFDAHAQRLVLLLRQMHSQISSTTCRTTSISRKKPNLKGKSNSNTTKKVSLLGHEINMNDPLIEEVLECCAAMLSLDPSSRETVHLLTQLDEKGLLGPPLSTFLKLQSDALDDDK